MCQTQQSYFSFYEFEYFYEFVPIHTLATFHQFEVLLYLQCLEGLIDIHL